MLMYVKSDAVQSLLVDVGEFAKCGTRYCPCHLTVVQNYEFRRQQPVVAPTGGFKLSSSSSDRGVKLRVYRGPRSSIYYSRNNDHCGGRGNLVVEKSDSWLVCHEFEPSTTEDPPCRGAMYVKNVESSSVLLRVKCGS
ncbi:hypothetical protein TNCV_4022491 [Trichonephila clavipes]|nr:hypothetical protein TNCV_4022491 [Trichonephila clavipes]